MMMTHLEGHGLDLEPRNRFCFLPTAWQSSVASADDAMQAFIISTHMNHCSAVFGNDFENKTVQMWFTSRGRGGRVARRPPLSARTCASSRRRARPRGYKRVRSSAAQAHTIKESLVSRY